MFFKALRRENEKLLNENSKLRERRRSVFCANCKHALIRELPSLDSAYVYTELACELDCDCKNFQKK